MRRIIPFQVIADVSRRWLGSPFVDEQIERALGRRISFSAEECDAFGWYMPHAGRVAPTHAVPKMPFNLVLELGLKNDGLLPAAEIEVLPKIFRHQPCERWNANRKLGVAVMRRVVEKARVEVQEFGSYEFVVDEAGHFGFGGLYANMLADEGLMCVIWNTAGRGNEVFPFGGDTTRPECARMGTNPITLSLPTKQVLGFNFVADFATSALSFGALSRHRLLGRSLKSGVAVTKEGSATTDPLSAARLLYDSHRMYSLGLWIEAVAALIGGGPPEERCMKQGDRPGGAANWVIRVIDPRLYQIKSGDGIERMCHNLRHIVEHNGDARIPGASYLRNAMEFGGDVPMEPPIFDKFVEMARQAELVLDESSFRSVE